MYIVYTFEPYIGIFIDIYLDDIIIYLDILKEHITHVKTILQILECEKLYLSALKLDFLCFKVKVLRCMVDNEGIQVDPHKVDLLMKWKTPTNCDLLQGFLGAVGYLANDIDHV
ncbi:DNA/RNA polymerase [Pholiota conissans]|uniref:DNA/RNA polymerase n=1 Tax=Pholiota conissans TaxID=109636 RepID=A0A9P6CMK0_9AGAR|nr:DNA/RNA polymerase [Pholiota conissans]